MHFDPGPKIVSSRVRVFAVFCGAPSPLHGLVRRHQRCAVWNRLWRAAVEGRLRAERA
jgi:hypothetical protein